jgi:hypothetical protein
MSTPDKYPPPLAIPARWGVDTGPAGWSRAMHAFADYVHLVARAPGLGSREAILLVYGAATGAIEELLAHVLDVEVPE